MLEHFLRALVAVATLVLCVPDASAFSTRCFRGEAPYGPLTSTLFVETNWSVADALYLIFAVQDSEAIGPQNLTGFRVSSFQVFGVVTDRWFRHFIYDAPIPGAYAITGSATAFVLVGNPPVNPQPIFDTAGCAYAGALP